MAEHVKSILTWLKRIQRSKLSAPKYFTEYDVPFSLAQYYRYQRDFQEFGADGLSDSRGLGNNRRLHSEAEEFVAGYMLARPETTQAELKRVIEERFRIGISVSGVSRCLERLDLRRKRETRRSAAPVECSAPYAGFELIVALAWHVNWPQRTAEIIRSALKQAYKSEQFAPSDQALDITGRNRRGQFTARYNRRQDVRGERFASVEKKRHLKSLERMDLGKITDETLTRKCMAILMLPVVTNNGEVRSVDTAKGQALKALCGFQYQQATLQRFLSELKYLGASTELLRHQVGYWQNVWDGKRPAEKHLPLLCYYVDGNTKALWSRKRVKKNKGSSPYRVGDFD